MKPEFLQNFKVGDASLPKDAITAARGRSAKAIQALLDVDTLKASKDQTADIKKALEELKKDSGYLFESDEVPPPFTFRIDYTDQIPANGGIFPSGLEEISRRTDICGNTTVTNQYNFGLYYVFEKAPGDDAGAQVNAGWIMGFQEWVQEQSVLGLAPVFGDVPRQEKITAQNGVLYAAEDEGLATYMVQLSVRFVKEFPTTDPWFM